MKKFVIFGLIAFILVYFFLQSQTKQYSNPSNIKIGSEVTEDKKLISKEEAIKYSWSAIKQFVEGEETVEVCNIDLDNCYSLEVSILGGDISEVHFSNGGYIKLTAELDQNGEADAYDNDSGYLWSFKINMNSPLINNALESWADLNDYRFQ